MIQVIMAAFKLQNQICIKNKNFGRLDFRRCKIAYAARPQVALYSAKGQLISKCLFGIFNSSKKMNENFLPNCYGWTHCSAVYSGQFLYIHISTGITP